MVMMMIIIIINLEKGKIIIIIPSELIPDKLTVVQQLNIIRTSSLKVIKFITVRTPASLWPTSLDYLNIIFPYTSNYLLRSKVFQA